MSQITIACLGMVGTTVADDRDGDGAVTPLLGAVETMVALRAAGIRVCLTSEFTPPARDAVLDALGWWPLIDLALSPADAGRGRPWPDLPLAALLRLGGGAVGELAVVGAAVGDVESGLRAGAGLVVGVLTGSASREELADAGAPHILDAVTGLLSLLGLGTPEPALMRSRAAPDDSPG